MSSVPQLGSYSFAREFMQNNEIYFLAGLPKAGTTAIATWMTEALGLPRGLKEPGFFYNCSDLVSC